jgi:hypothetical protein
MKLNKTDCYDTKLCILKIISFVISLRICYYKKCVLSPFFFIIAVTIENTYSLHFYYVTIENAYSLPPGGLCCSSIEAH